MTQTVIESSEIVLPSAWWQVFRLATRQSDGATIMQVADWRGGEGDRPPVGYIRPDGTLTANPAEAQPLRIDGVAGTAAIKAKLQASMSIAAGTDGETPANWQNLSDWTADNNANPGDTGARLRIPREPPAGAAGLFVEVTRDGEPSARTLAWQGFGNREMVIAIGEALTLRYTADKSADTDFLAVAVTTGTLAHNVSLRVYTLGAAQAGGSPGSVQPNVAIITYQEEQRTVTVRGVDAHGDSYNPLIIPLDDPDAPAITYGMLAATLKARFITPDERAKLGDIEERAQQNPDYGTVADPLAYTRQAAPYALAQGRVAGSVHDTGIDVEGGANRLVVGIEGVQQGAAIDAGRWRELPDVQVGTDVLLSSAQDHLAFTIDGRQFYAAKHGTRLLLASGTIGDTQTMEVEIEGYRLADAADRNKAARFDKDRLPSDTVYHDQLPTTTGLSAAGVTALLNTAIPPKTRVPDFNQQQANQFPRANADGSALVFGDIPSQRIPSGNTLPRGVDVGYRFILLQPYAAPNDRAFIFDSQQDLTINSITFADSPSPGPDRLRGYSAGHGNAALRGKVFVFTKGATTRTMNRLYAHDGGQVRRSYAISRTAFTAIGPHAYEVEGFSYGDFVDLSIAQTENDGFYNVSFADGTWLYAPTNYAPGDYTYSGPPTDPPWELTPGVAASWATQGQAEPETQLRLHALNEGPGTGVSPAQPNINTRTAGAPILFDPGFDLDDADKQSGMILAVARLHVATGTASFAASGTAVTEKEVSGITSAPSVRASGQYAANATNGVQVGPNVPVYQGGTHLGDIRVMLTRNADNSAGYYLLWASANAGGTSISVGIAFDVYWLPAVANA